MPTIVIDLYDIGVLVSDGSQVLIDSASCALIESYESIIIGEPARQQARLRPREISTQFWGQLSSSSNTKLVVSNAELAFIFDRDRQDIYHNLKVLKKKGLVKVEKESGRTHLYVDEGKMESDESKEFNRIVKEQRETMERSGIIGQKDEIVEVQPLDQDPEEPEKPLSPPLKKYKEKYGIKDK